MRKNRISLLLSTGHLRYLKLGCLENPTYVEVISHSQGYLPICYYISTLLVANSVMTKTRLCRSDNLLPIEKYYLFPPSCFELRSKNYRSDCYFGFFPPRFLEWESFSDCAFPDLCLLVPFHDQQRRIK